MTTAVSAVSLHLKNIWDVYWTLIKIMVPTLIAVKLLSDLGGVEFLAQLLAPLMSLVGLPAEWGLVWAVGILTNIYTAMAVFYEVAAQNDFSVAEVSVLGLLILVAHSLPVEGAVAKATGVTWLLTLTFRVVGALVLAAVVSTIYDLGSFQQQQVTLLWQPDVRTDSSWTAWIVEQAQMLVSVLCIIAVLMTGLKLLDVLKMDRLIHALLRPVMRLLTLGKSASNITLIGVTLGISFGAGLLINEVRKGGISRRDTIIAVSFLGLSHSLIEDTILILLLGADIWAVLWGRLIFSILVISIWARWWLKDIPAAQN
ncbi:nucleoside recognition domain-containing protein [Veronia pacifica]|uniref:Nucleoside transporter/FeoB GTPase Gate domain-containing protein n=1 Tax=Veronia pacifica TaxID=1080227 RepID=A0A1C3EB82_9GAMM|nr:nucleoside recognition domain-containing protein [Veronia pacifica]ODA30495.1 hypothetical protein A8L45_20070 [Veronia pacifica]